MLLKIFNFFYKNVSYIRWFQKIFFFKYVTCTDSDVLLLRLICRNIVVKNKLYFYYLCLLIENKIVFIRCVKNNLFLFSLRLFLVSLINLLLRKLKFLIFYVGNLLMHWVNRINYILKYA